MPDIGDPIVLDDPETAEATRNYENRLSRVMEAINSTGPDNDPTLTLELEYRYAQVEALIEVAKSRNRLGDYVGAAKSEVMAVGLDKLNIDVAKSLFGINYEGRYFSILEQIKDTYTSTSDIPRAIGVLDEMIELMQKQKNTFGKEIYDSERIRLFDQYDEGIVNVPHTVDASGILFSQHARFGSDQFVNDSIDLLTDYDEKFNPLPALAKESRSFLITPELCSRYEVGLVENGGSALHFAAHIGKLDISDVLVTAGADVNLVAPGGFTPLHMACLWGRFEVAKLLIDAGADIDISDDLSWTPLHHAADAGELEIVAILIDNGADLNPKNDDGTTPRELAKVNEHYEVAGLK